MSREPEAWMVERQKEGEWRWVGASNHEDEAERFAQDERRAGSPARVVPLYRRAERAEPDGALRRAWDIHWLQNILDRAKEGEPSQAEPAWAYDRLIVLASSLLDEVASPPVPQEREGLVERIEDMREERRQHRMELALYREMGGPDFRREVEEELDRRLATSSPAEASEPEVTVRHARFVPEIHASGIFDRLERFTPEQRARLFCALETRWCWDCGLEQTECSGHAQEEVDPVAWRWRVNYQRDDQSPGNWHHEAWPPPPLTGPGIEREPLYRSPVPAIRVVTDDSLPPGVIEREGAEGALRERDVSLVVQRAMLDARKVERDDDYAALAEIAERAVRALASQRVETEGES